VKNRKWLVFHFKCGIQKMVRWTLFRISRWTRNEKNGTRSRFPFFVIPNEVRKTN